MAGRASLALVAAVATGWLGHARAGDDDLFALSPAELAALPVTIATGTPRPVFQSAAVTSVVTAEQIKAMGATELHQVLETVPGVQVGLQASTFDHQYSLRGIANPTNAQLLILLNGVRITTPFRGALTSGLELPIEAIERVEVIRGPGSALYGADAFAGVINIITKKAADIGGTRMGGRVGEWDTHSGWLQHGGTWHGWDVALSFQHQHSAGDDGRILRTDVQTLYDQAQGTRASRAPAALASRHEAVNSHLSLKRRQWEMNFWAFNLLDSGTRAGPAGALDPTGAAVANTYLADVRFTADDWAEDWRFSAHANYLYSQFHVDFQAFPPGARLPIGGDGNIRPPAPTRFGRGAGGLVEFPAGANVSMGRQENIPALDLAASYAGIGGHLLHVGLGFRHEQLSAHELKNFGPGIIDGTEGVVGGALTDVSGTPYVYLPDTQRSVWSAVLQDEWALAKSWQLTTGVRYDHYSDFGDTVNPRAALVWDISPSLTSKLLFGRAFRAPSFSEMGNQNNPVLLGNRRLTPETINTYEWAVDFRPAAAFRGAVNLFHYQISDLIRPVPDLNRPTSTFQNIGNQDGHGAELEWSWQVAEAVRLMGNYAWQHAVSLDTGAAVPYVPTQQVYAALEWRFMPKWQLLPQLNWAGGRGIAAHDLKPLADYESVDITVRGRRLYQHLDVLASVRNVFGQRDCQRVAMPLPENIPMPGRSFYFELSVDF